MNEEGKSFFSSYKSFIFFLLVLLSFCPYVDFITDENIERLFSSDVLPENLLVFTSCASFFGFIWLFSYLGSWILSLLVHLGMRLFFLHKLRKPVLLYTGDPDYKASEGDQSSKLGKIITFLKSDRFEEIFMYSVAFLSLLCMCFAEW